jgi:hypothetical protein
MQVSAARLAVGRPWPQTHRMEPRSARNNRSPLPTRLKAWGVMRRTWRRSPGASEASRYFAVNDGDLPIEASLSCTSGRQYFHLTVVSYLHHGEVYKSDLFTCTHLLCFHSIPGTGTALALSHLVPKDTTVEPCLKQRR